MRGDVFSKSQTVKRVQRRRPRIFAGAAGNRTSTPTCRECSHDAGSSRYWARLLVLPRQTVLLNLPTRYRISKVLHDLACERGVHSRSWRTTSAVRLRHRRIDHKCYRRSAAIWTRGRAIWRPDRCGFHAGYRVTSRTHTDRVGLSSHPK